ncbi:hypothetical protein MOE97_16650 [Bacillus spizizenii]|nr:hypothetical protein [Bacillus spizizenii]
MKTTLNQKENIQYFYGGSLFEEYVDFNFFKEALIKSGFKVNDKKNINDIYEYIVNEEDWSSKKIVDKVYFESILYSHLKNVYVHTFNKLSIDLFKQNMDKILGQLKTDSNIHTNFQRYMNKDGFYLMDALNITVPGSTFISGLDYVENNGEIQKARLLLVQTVKNEEDKNKYFIAGIEINFIERTCLIMIRNIPNIKEPDENTSDYNRSISKLYNYVKERIVKKLVGNVTDISRDSDRESMYRICKKLDEDLLKDVRQEVTDKAYTTIVDSVNNYMKKLYTVNERPGKHDREELVKNIQSLLLSNYINNKFDAKQLVKKAKKLNLIGYTTKLKFKGNNSNTGSTRSSSSKHPVSQSDMFHSLYINFEGAKELEHWGISWFTDTKFSDEKDIDVIQTTIYSTSKYFKIVFLPKKPLNEEIINYVVRQLNKQRSLKPVNE